MTQRDKSSYTGKQKRQAQPIGKGHGERCVAAKAAFARAWATVNKVSGGGKNTGSGRRHHSSR